VTRYDVDAAQSEVRVAATSSLHAITGRAEGLRGWADLDGTTVRGARIELDAEQLRWGNPLLDRETRRRIDTARHPTIVGTMTAMESNDDGSARLRGTIAFHGVERAVSGVVAVTMATADALMIEGEHTFDVRDWGLEPPRLLMLKVDPQIVVSIRVLVSRVR
jgi:polyisoprenoid-binding protein YceI